MMKLTDFYPTPSALIENELVTLKLLSDNPYFSTEHSQFVNDASASYTQYRYRKSGFRFESYLNVVHTEMPVSKLIDPVTGRKKPNLQLMIGGLIDQNAMKAFENISYYLLVSRVRTRPTLPTILRKFHFDVIPLATSTRRQSHPLCHFQYCGKMTQLMGRHGYQPEHLKHLHGELSEPRVFFWPMSLALLIDLALREFAETDSYTFRQTNEWRSVIKKNETLLLQRFHEKCLDVINSSVKDRSTLSEEFYIR